MFRTSYSFVAQSRPGVPDSMARIWYGQYNPSSCSYAPFYVSAEHIPQAYTRYERVPSVLVLGLRSCSMHRDGDSKF